MEIKKRNRTFKNWESLNYAIISKIVYQLINSLHVLIIMTLNNLIKAILKP
jgi:hypothetical protein